MHGVVRSSFHDRPEPRWGGSVTDGGIETADTSSISSRVKALRLVDWTYQFCTQPQEPYFDLLDRVHQHLLPRTYVEIGVSTARSLTLSLPGTVTIGIDPVPRVAFPLNRQTQVFAQTSDDFFASHQLDVLFDGVPLDLAFIDGMHNFEYALRDFINLEAAAHPDTTILIHDCMPTDELHRARERAAARWAGDIWRLILLLREWRPDLNVVVADSAPSGLGIVRGLDPHSSVLSDHYDQIVEKYLAVPYGSLDDGSMADHLNRIPGDWATVRQQLPKTPFRHGNLERLKAERLGRAIGPAMVRGVQRAQRQMKAHRRAGTSNGPARAR